MKVMVQPAFCIYGGRLEDLDPFAAKMKGAASELKAAGRMFPAAYAHFKRRRAA